MLVNINFIKETKKKVVQFLVESLDKLLENSYLEIRGKVNYLKKLKGCDYKVKTYKNKVLIYKKLGSIVHKAKYVVDLEEEKNYYLI